MKNRNASFSPTSLTATLKALLISGTVALGISNAPAAASTPASTGPDDLQTRLNRVRGQLDKSTDRTLNPADGTESAPDEVRRFWRNWGNGGWGPRRNWGNGWPNWPNWNNWRNGGPRIWANF